MVFENPLEEHIALEIAREGIWVDPRKKVAYTAEEGHAFERRLPPSLSVISRAISPAGTWPRKGTPSSS